MYSHSHKPSLRVNFVLNTFLQILNMIAPFLTAPYISRVLGVDQVGVYSYTYSINYYFVMLAGLGTATYGTIEIAKVRDDVEERSRAFWGIEMITILTSTVCIVAWIAFSICYQAHTVILLTMTMYLVAVVFDVSWFFLGMERVQYSVLVNAFFKIMGIILLFLLVKSPQDLNKYVFILSGTMLAGNASMWLFLPRFVTGAKVTGKTLWKHVRGTMLYFIPTVATSVYMVLDKTLIGAITHDNAQNAYYEQATKVISLVKTVTFTSLNTLLGSRMAYLFAQNQKQEIAEKRDFALEYVLAIGIGAGFGIMGVSRIFVPIFFGKEFTQASAFLILMTPLIPVMGISNLIGNLYYNPSGRRKQSTILLLIGCMVNIALNAVLIPRFYGQGAIVASLIAEVLITAMYVHCSREFVTGSMVFRSAWKKVAAGFVMLLYLVIAERCWGFGLVTLAAQCIGGLAVYLGMLAVLHDPFLQHIRTKLRKSR